MTIFVESRASEVNLASAIRVEHLEEWTGADVMISRLSMPCKNRTLLAKHIDEGAILIQIKYGEDLAASVGDRLNEHLARMISCTRRTCQHLLLFVGTLGCDSEGLALINGRKTHTSMSFNALNMAIFSWIARGGVYFPLSRVGELQPFVEQVENKLGQFYVESYKYILSKPEMPPDLPDIHDDPLQLLIPVKDARTVLIGFRGLGVEKVNKIWAYCGDFKSAMHFLTDYESVGKIDGIGKMTITSIRKQCGLSESDGAIVWETDTKISLESQNAKDTASTLLSASRPQ